MWPKHIFAEFKSIEKLPMHVIMCTVQNTSYI